MKKIRILVVFCVLFATISLAVSAQTPKNKWAKYDGGKVHYYDIGGKEKKALILIHGWTCNADMWEKSLMGFPGYRVIAIDLPGHGQSSKPKTTYSMEYFARSIDAVMKAAKVRQAVLVGHSMGTPVIRQFYRLYPQETIGLVVVDGPLKPFGPRAQMDKFFDPLFANYQTESPKFIDGMLGPTRDDLKEPIRVVMLSTPDYVGVSAMQGMLDDSIWRDDKIDIPVLAVMNAGGRWPKDNATIYASVAPNLEYQSWSGVSHFLFMEKPTEFNAAIKAYIVKNKLL